MTNLIRASRPIFTIAILGTFVTGIVLAGLGVLLVYLGVTGNTEFIFFGQGFKSANVGIAAIFLGSTTIVLIVRRTLKSTDAAIVVEGKINNLQKLDSQVKIVDCLVSYTKKGGIIQTAIDVKFRNIGNMTAFLKRTDFLIEGSATFVDCNYPRYCLENVSVTYDVDIEANRSIPISNSIKPNEVERFQLIVGRKHGGPSLTVYKAKLRILYDEDNKCVESEPFFIKLTGPSVPLASYIHGVSKEEWDACMEKNRRAFAAIGFDIYNEIGYEKN